MRRVAKKSHCLRRYCPHSQEGNPAGNNMIIEKHSEAGESREKFSGKIFRRARRVRTLRSKNAWIKKYVTEGWLTHVEKEGNFYCIYRRRRSK